MRKAFAIKDKDSEKFWNIHYSGQDFMVNYGEAGAFGKFEVQEFDSAEECAEKAESLIAQKISEGYKEANFDYNKHFYFDDDEIGLHPKTSHPKFAEHFVDELYYDCCDEEAPFGSDEGSDALAEIENQLREGTSAQFGDFPRLIIEDIWGMEYIPVESLEVDNVKVWLANDEMNVVQSDIITVSCAFAQIKITGSLDTGLKQRALSSMHRISITASLLGWGTGEASSEIISKMLTDLTAFTSN